LRVVTNIRHVADLPTEGVRGGTDEVGGKARKHWGKTLVAEKGASGGRASEEEPAGSTMSLLLTQEVGNAYPPQQAAGL
jgi:hypothetical protein